MAKAKDDTSAGVQLTITPRGLRALIPAVPRKQAIFVQGEPGSGKTETGYEVSRTEKEDLCEVVILALRPPEDIGGLPDLDREKGVTKWLPPDWFVRLAYNRFTGKPRPISEFRATCFFDEGNAAPPATMLAAQRIARERRLNDWEFHPGVRVLLTGNRLEDAAFAQEMPTSFANRCMHVDLVPDLGEWIEDFAIPRGFSHETVGFLRSKPSAFRTFDPERTRRAFASPRSWEGADDFLKSALAANLSDGLTYVGLAGLIGEGVSTEFLAFRKLRNEVPTPAQIEKDPEGTPIPGSPSTLWYSMGWLSSELARGYTDSRMAAYMKWVLRCGRDEFVVGFVRDVLYGPVKESALKCDAFREPAFGLVMDVKGRRVAKR